MEDKNVIKLTVLLALFLVATLFVVAKMEPNVVPDRDDSHLYEPLPTQIEVPTANLPKDLRQKNWRHPRNGQGSCVIASSVSALRWAGQTDMANLFRRSYAGGQTATSILRYFSDNNIPHKYTRRGDPSIFDFIDEGRYMAVIFYKPAHSISYVGSIYKNGKRYAVTMDNNMTHRYEEWEWNSFVRKWRGYGGFALVPLYNPASPLVYPSIKKKS